jgi:hypothetical protein
MTAQAHQTNASDHLMGVSLKLFQHPIGVFKIGWLAEKRGIQIHQSVRPQDQRIGKTLRHGPGFPVRINLGNLASRQLLVVHFARITG